MMIPLSNTRNMRLIRKIIDRKNFSLFDIPENFGKKVEVIIRPVVEQPLQKEGKPLTESNETKMNAEESALIANYLETLDNDTWEDQVWKKYL